MKIGVSSYSFLRHIRNTGADYVSVCDKAKEMGYEGIEFIDLDDKCFRFEIEPFAEARRIKEHCRSIGLPIIAYAVSANFLADDIDAEISRIKRCVDIAAELGAPILRHDVCYSLKEGQTPEDAAKIMAPRIREVSEYAKEKGIMTCTENHGFIFQAPERLRMLIEEVGSDNYRWLCDIGNFLCADADPVGSVKIAAPYTVHAHAKDFFLVPAGNEAPEGYFKSSGGNFLRGTVLGHGVVRIKECIGALRAAGYDGWLSVEFEGGEDNLGALEEGIAYLKRII